MESTDDLRSPTPESVVESTMSDSLHQAMATIDDITVKLSDFSRTASPEPPNLLQCCCDCEACEHRNTWLAFKTKLEGRLVLSAQVGQALLRKLEAYSRKEPDKQQMPANQGFLPPSSLRDEHTNPSELAKAEAGNDSDDRLKELVKENAALKHKFNSALFNADVAEASNKALLNQLEDARKTISTLKTYRSKAIALETKLEAALRDLEDVRQEHQSEEHRAKVAAIKVATLSQRCSKLQTQVHHLYNELTQQRQTRAELSEEILRDARARLEMLQQAQSGRVFISEHDEVKNMMESLVAENEALKSNAAQLQNLLLEAQEDIRVLREVAIEKGAVPGGRPSPTRMVTPLSHHVRSGSWQSSFGYDRFGLTSPKLMGRTDASGLWSPIQPSVQSTTVQRRSDSKEPVSRTFNDKLATSALAHRPLTPVSHIYHMESRSACSSPRLGDLTLQSPCRSGFLCHEENVDNVGRLPYTHDKSTQTDYSDSIHLPSRPGSTAPFSTASALDMRSEESSMLEAGVSPIAAMLTCIDGLLARLTQADALTLTNRLKRQHLKGADVRHISRTTVNTILSEVRGLRQRYSNLFEHERTSWTRKELVFFFRVITTVFGELSKIRIILNDIILNPSIARSVSESVMNPPLGNDKLVDPGRSTPSFVGWMAPITRFLSGPSHDISTHRSAHSDYNTEPDSLSLASTVPKLPPALAATTATVNVEFYRRGMGQALVNSGSGNDDVFEGINAATNLSSGTKSTVMDIFAGAPRKRGTESWVFIPSRPKERRDEVRPAQLDILAKRGRTDKIFGLSRTVDAVVDHASDHTAFMVPTEEPLLPRTLRRRGLSDSSIRSTFVNDSDKDRLVHSSRLRVRYSNQRQTDGFDLVSPAKVPQQLWSDELRPEPRPHANVNSEVANLNKTNPHGINILPNIASWAASGAGLRGDLAEQFVGSFVESGLSSGHQRDSPWPRDMLGRDI